MARMAELWRSGGVSVRAASVSDRRAWLELLLSEPGFLGLTDGQDG